MSSTYSREQLVKVSKLYYLGNMSQEDISKIMNISRPMISRMLSMARERKVVEFKINSSPSLYSEMSKKIQDFYNLKYVYVVPSSFSQEESKLEVAKKAADFLNLQLKNDIVIGCAWGTTIDRFVHAFLPEKTISGASVMQLTGSLNAHIVETDGRELAKELATKLNAQLYTLQTPLIVGNPLLKQLLIDEPETRRQFDMFRNIDIAFVGVGSSKPENSVSYKAGYITKEEAQVLEDMGAGADICGHRITKNGNKVQTILTDRVISIDLDTLKQIPLVVALGAGEDKTPTIVAGIRGKYIDAIIIDELAAISIIETEKMI
ncbi:MAG: sugar-binding domain-containing protein [Christensenellaceae bacterium]